MIEKQTATVSRKWGLSKDDLKEHIKSIGLTIMKDAEQLSDHPETIKYLGITAMVNPMTEVTKVRYTLDRISDPRVAGWKNCYGEPIERKEEE